MKTFSVLILLVILNCAPVNYADQKQHSDYYRPVGSEKTVFLIDRKEYNMQEFNRLYNKGRIKNFDIIKDSLTIKSMNYSPKVKSIVVGKTK